jgi:alkylated DNA nucleotide flippase Atl1
MIEPTVTPWIKQRDNLSRNRIDTGQVRAFAEIAAVTGKGQIARIVGPNVLTGRSTSKERARCGV